MSSKKAKELKLKPLAKIVSYADDADEPKNFITAPAKDIKKSLKKNKNYINNIDYYELNEAFSVVGLANMKILGISKEKINVNGGAVSIDNPLGVSGTRIIMSLINTLHQNNGDVGVAAIFNGGGGASAMILKKIKLLVYNKFCLKQKNKYICILNFLKNIYSKKNYF